jgi:hexosaminidase
MKKSRLAALPTWCLLLAFLNPVLQQSYDFLTSTARSGVFDGMISTSWDDSGLHNQVWMLRFATAAASHGMEAGRNWMNSRTRSLKITTDHLLRIWKKFTSSSLKPPSTRCRRWSEMCGIMVILDKTHLPDLPGGDALEYDPYWRKEYSDIVVKSEEMATKMQRALQIINANLTSGAKNPHDFEIFQSIANRGIRHNFTKTFPGWNTLSRKRTEAILKVMISPMIILKRLHLLWNLV